MTRRAEAILRGCAERRPAGTRIWGGTFHAIATRLLRLHAPRPRHGTGVHDPRPRRLRGPHARCAARSSAWRTDRRFPQKGTCLDIYCRCVNTRHPLEDVLKRSFPWCPARRTTCKRLFAEYVERKARQNVLDYDDLLLYWHGLLEDRPPGAGSAAVRQGARRRVSGHELAAGARSCGCCGPTATGVTVVGDDAQSIYSFRAADRAQHPRLPRGFPRCRDRAASSRTTARHRPHPGRDERGDRRGRRAPRQGAVDRPTRTAASRRLVSCRDEDEQTGLHRCERMLGAPRGRGAAPEAGRALPGAASLPAARDGAAAPQHPVSQVRGLKFTETAHVKDLIGLLRLAENPRDEAAGLRVLTLLPGRRSADGAAAHGHAARRGR